MQLYKEKIDVAYSILKAINPESLSSRGNAVFAILVDRSLVAASTNAVVYVPNAVVGGQMVGDDVLSTKDVIAFVESRDDEAPSRHGIAFTTKRSVIRVENVWPAVRRKIDRAVTIIDMEYSANCLAGVSISTVVMELLVRAVNSVDLSGTIALAASTGSVNVFKRGNTPAESRVVRAGFSGVETYAYILPAA